MRMTGIRMCLLTFLPLAFVCQSANRSTLAKVKNEDASERKNVKLEWPPKGGVKTPGVQIPIATLKAEADIAASGAVGAFLVGDGVYIGADGQSGLLPLNLKTNKTEALVEGVSKPCSTMVSAFGSIWAPSCHDKTVVRLDSKTKKVTATLPLVPIAGRYTMAASSDSVWALTDDKTTLARVDPEENQIVAEVRLPAGCNSMLFAENALWVTCPQEDKVLRIDTGTNLVSNRITVEGQPMAMTSGESTIWVLGKAEGKIVRIDPKTNKATTTIELKTPGTGGDLAFGEGFVWASTPGFPISRIDPATDKVVQQFAGDGGGAIYFGQGSVWLPGLKPNTVSRFEPKRIKATLAE